MIDRMKGFRLLKTAIRREVGIVSAGLEEGRIWETIGVRSSREIVLNWHNEGTEGGWTAMVILGSDILDLIVLTLSMKNDRNCSQSSSEKTGTGGGAGLTRVLITAKRALGLFLLRLIKLEK